MSEVSMVPVSTSPRRVLPGPKVGGKSEVIIDSFEEGSGIDHMGSPNIEWTPDTTWHTHGERSMEIQNNGGAEEFFGAMLPGELDISNGNNCIKFDLKGSGDPDSLGFQFILLEGTTNGDGESWISPSISLADTSAYEVILPYTNFTNMYPGSGNDTLELFIQAYQFLYADSVGSHLVDNIRSGFEVGVEEETAVDSRGRQVLEVHPNPTKAGANIKYHISEAAQVTLKIYNQVGQLVRRLVDENKSAGSHEIRWSSLDEQGIKVAAGIYFCRMETPQGIESRKIVIVK